MADSLGVRRGARFARALASPIGVLVTVPLLVVAVGVGILLLGRDATRSATDQLVRQQLGEQAKQIESDFAIALDQAEPMLASLRALVHPARPSDDLLLRLHDLIVGRPGVSYVSVSFPDGRYLQADASKGKVSLSKSQVEASGTRAEWFAIRDGALASERVETTAYDPRKRPFWDIATKTRARAWTPPYPFFRSNETGITCTEPIYAGAEVYAVITVDFEVQRLSSFVSRPGLAEARSIVYTGEGVILAYPAGAKLALPTTEKLLRAADLADPAIDALFAAGTAREPRFLELAANDGEYLASVAPIGGRRAGVAVPLDWYVATIVPVHTLLGPTKQLERTSLLASGGALALAVGLALVFAWNVVRMRRQVARSREEASAARKIASELGSYRLVAKLGAGGMGEVWRAEHRMLARSAAIKVIRPEALRDPEAVPEIRERFRREAQTLASMKSRHTIEIYDYGVTDAGDFYYVMELLDGLDLETLIVRYGAQPAARVIPMLAQACASLAEAHDAGLLHRDIKPPNLFVSRVADEVDIVKLLDFGIVHSISETPEAVVTIAPAKLPDTEKLTQIGAMLGTPGFMAPEQILGMQLDGRSDIYALGCVAWWLLAGREVFDRGQVSDAKLLNKHVYEQIPSLRMAVRGWCPPELELLVGRCLAKELDQRPTARELRRDLAAIVIPVDQAWTGERALAWWQEYKAPIQPAKVATADVKLVVQEQLGVAATVAQAKRSRR